MKCNHSLGNAGEELIVFRHNSSLRQISLKTEKHELCGCAIVIIQSFKHFCVWKQTLKSLHLAKEQTNVKYFSKLVRCME